MMEEKPKTDDVKKLKFGKRTYFFDVKEATNGNKYLRITESRFIKEGEERKRNYFTLFRDEIKDFIKELELASKEL